MRQLQSSDAGFDSTTPILPISQGGHGTDNAIDGVHALGGIHVSELGTPGGVAKLIENKKLPLSVFQDGVVSFYGFAIDGPDYLVNGMTSRFRINDATILLSPAPVISVDVGSVIIDGDELLVTAPETGDRLTLTLGVRSITFEVVEEGIVNPTGSFVQVIDGSGPVALIGHAFRAEPVLYSQWVDVTDAYGEPISLGDAILLEVEGAVGNNGQASVSLNGLVHSLSRVDSYRVFKIDETVTAAAVNSNGTGRLRTRFGYNSLNHASTDWEVATDPDFVDIVFSSMMDTDNLTAVEVTLPAGSYYVRYTYYGSVPNTES